MGDLAFAFQLAELEQVLKLRNQYGSGRSLPMATPNSKYTNYNTIYRTNNTSQTKPRRTNSGSDNAMMYSNPNGNRRQRHQNYQSQPQYYRSYDNYQLNQIHTQNQYQTFEPIARPASQPAFLDTPPISTSSSSSNGLTSQFLESLLVQQMQRSQTPTQLSQPQPQVSDNFPFFEIPPPSAMSTTNATISTNSPTSTLLNTHSAFSSSTNNNNTNNNTSNTFDTFPSLQSQLSLDDLPLYSQPNVATPISSPTSTSQFQPHQLMNFIFSDPSPSPTAVTPSTITRPGSALRSTSDNSSSTSNDISGSADSAGASSGKNGLVDPLESIWKRDSNITSSNTSTVGLNQTIGDNVGAYF